MRAKIFFAAILLAAPVSAADKGIDFTQSITGLDGKPMMECKQPEIGKDGKSFCAKTGPITLGEVAASALSLPERGIPLDEQVRRAKLAQSIVDAKSYALTADDTKRIESCLPGLNFSPLLAYSVVKVIDPASIPK